MAKPTGITKQSQPTKSSWWAIFCKKKKPKSILYSTLREYRGIAVRFIVEKRDSDLNTVKVSVGTDIDSIISSGYYTNTTIDEQSINGAFDSLFKSVKRDIDNYHDYEVKIQSALLKVSNQLK